MVTARADPAAVDEACALLGPLAERNGALGLLTTYRVGGPAAVLASVRSTGDLAVVATAVSTTGLPVAVVGRGSNLLVSDAGFPGIAVVLNAAPEAFGGIGIDGSVVHAGAAVPLPALARRSADAGLTGFEWAVGVPGSVGGAVRMNAGGHGSDMAACLLRCHRVDLHAGGEVAPVPVDELALGYRRSAIASHHVVVGAELALSPGDAKASRVTIREIVRWRRDHQPGGHNAGSVFTNPVADPLGRSAGWFIDAAGMKGHRLGSAMVSPKHANFIQADPGGSADDVARLICLVGDVVAARFGTLLHPEVRMIGFGEHTNDPSPSSSSRGAP